MFKYFKIGKRTVVLLKLRAKAVKTTLQNKRKEELRKLDQFKSYMYVYDDLINLSSDGLGYVLGLLFWRVFFLLALLLPLFFASTERLAFVFIGIAFVFFGTVYGTFLLLMGFTVARDPARKVPIIATRILAGVPRPYSKSRGLVYSEIKQLQRFAEIEQNSADWGGSFISVVIIGTITALISFLSIVGNGFPDESQQPEAWLAFQSRFIQMMPQWLLILVIILGFIFAMWAIINLLLYLFRYLLRESSNRIVLLSCEEALALLRTYGLSESLNLELHQKRALVAHLGCRLLPINQATIFDKLFWTWYPDINGTKWYIVPPIEFSFRARMINIWRNLHREK